MSNSVKILVKSFILLVYIFVILSILESHYVAMGECAARIYYYPLGRWDYILIPLVGIILLSLSLYFIHTSPKMRIIEWLLYSCIIITTLIWGNDLLASPTIDWPDQYHPTSYNMEKRIETQLMGMWTYQAGNVDSDNFLTDTITFAQDNLSYNEDGIYQYTYHIEDNKLFIHRPNRAVKQYKAEIEDDTLKLTLLKEALFEFDVELRQVESLNDIPSPSYKYIKLN
ncbi:hypothetical protein [uncultured Muribaculum sp.]|nr:hypothetical protein [uncultured Muribaculum sp.]